MESSDGAASPKDTVRKTWRGAATFIPKVPGTAKKQSAGSKQVGPFNLTLQVQTSLLHLGEQFVFCLSAVFQDGVYILPMFSRL